MWAPVLNNVVVIVTGIVFHLHAAARPTWTRAASPTRRSPSSASA
jgi:hypothetical protein